MAIHASDLEFVEYSPEYKHAFKALNQEWILKYFTMEAPDYEVLDHPQEYILDKGGHIYLAIYNKEPVAVCALLKLNDEVFELAKMAVLPAMQGKNIGYNFSLYVIEQAKKLNAKKLYLGSNTILEAALKLYTKLGFKIIPDHHNPYKRCNIHMEMPL